MAALDQQWAATGWTLCLDELPPHGTTLLGLTEHGVPVKSVWLAEFRWLAWMPVPRLSEAQRERIWAAKAAGLDITQPEMD